MAGISKQYKSPLCTNCRNMALVGPMEIKLQLCYLCIFERDRTLRKWKALKGSDIGGVME